MGLIVYNADTNTITASAFDNSAPCTFDDIYNADQANGWGVVEKLSDNIYKFYAKICFSYCYFKDTNKIIIFAHGVATANYTHYIDVVGDKDFTIGNIDDLEQKAGSQGCVFVCEEQAYANNYFLYINSLGVISILASSFISNYKSASLRLVSAGTTIRLWHSILHKNVSLVFYKPNFDPYNVVLHTQLSAACPAKVLIQNASRALYNVNGDMVDTEIVNCSTLSFIVNSSVTTRLVNVKTNTWNMYFADWDGVGLYGKLLEAYSFNIKTVDKNNIPLSGSSVKLYNKAGDLIFEDYTDENGNLSSEHIVTVREYFPPDDSAGYVGITDPAVDYNPFRLVIEKVGYATFDAQIWLDRKIDQEIALDGLRYTLDDIYSELQAHRNTVEPNIDTTISSRASQSSVDAIPTNPLLTNDTRLDNLDAPISSRKPNVIDFTQVDRDKLNSLDTSNLDVPVSSRLANNDIRLDNLDAKISSRSSHSPVDVRQEMDTNSTKLDVSISTRASQVSVDAIPTNPLLANDARLANLDAPISSRKAADQIDFTDSDRTKLFSLENYDDAELRSKIEQILQCEIGGRRLENNQLIYLAKDGVEIARFNLFDENGNPTMENVFRRVPV